MNQKTAHDSKHHDIDRTSVVITRRVRSGCEAAYEALLHGLLEDTKGFSGFQGAQVLRPKRPHRLEYQVTLHFENRQAKERWARSEERRRWVDGMKALADTPMITTLTGLEVWFTLPAEGHTKTAPRYKTALLVWAAVFPTVLVFSTLLSRLPLEMPAVLSVFVVTVLAIPVVVYIVLPRLTRLVESWLYSESSVSRDRDRHHPSSPERGGVEDA